MDIAKSVLHSLEYLKGFGVLAQFTDFKFIQKNQYDFASNIICDTRPLNNTSARLCAQTGLFHAVWWLYLQFYSVLQIQPMRSFHLHFLRA